MIATPRESRLLHEKPGLHTRQGATLFSRFSFCAAALAAFLAAGVAHAAAYPDKPIRFIVPFPPGGNIDTHARLVTQKLTEAWRQQMLIDNRPGAGGNIGLEIAAKAPHDGYTFVWSGTSTLAVGPHVYKKLNYSLDDFTPVVRAVDTQNVLVLHPSVPAQNVKQLIALSRARPGMLNFASSGAGTVSHLAGELFKSMAGVNIVHIPYKGSAFAMTDLISGQVGIMFDSLTSAMPQARAGKLHALAVTGLKRTSSYPELPTLSESGLPGFEVINWLGILAPKGVPPEMIARLNEQILAILKTPQMRERMATYGAEPAGSTPEEFGTFIRAESAKWGKIVRTVGLQPE
jgi:tripartite-type tricarboxylate transporter receptor subunit TctC